MLIELGTELTHDVRKKIERLERKRIKIYGSDVESERGLSHIVQRTIQKDPTHSEEEALFAIYSLLRPGEAPNVETARDQLAKVFFHPKRYDLGRVVLITSTYLDSCGG